jgi:mRNA interferase MazF
VVSAPQRGEVWWGEETSVGRRPFLVFSRDEVIPVLRTVLAVPATRTVRGIPTEVPLGPDDGMPDDCALSFDNATVLEQSLLVERICRLSPSQLDAACRAWKAAVAC